MVELLIKLVAGIILLLFAIVIGFGMWWLVEIPIRRWRALTFDYVYIDDNGNARELTVFENESVASALFPNGDADQLIKPHYESLTHDGRLRGYLPRRRLPNRISIAPALR